MAERVFQGNRLLHLVHPDQIHDEKTHRIHLVVSPRVADTFTETGRMAIWSVRTQYKSLKVALDSIGTSCALLLGRTDIPVEVQMVYNLAGTTGQRWHMDGLDGAFEIVIVPLMLTGTCQSTKILKYNFVSPLTPDWEAHVPTTDWATMDHYETALSPGDVMAFCSQCVHAGPGGGGKGRISLFMAWPANRRSGRSDTDTIVVNYDTWMEHMKTGQ